MAKQPCIFWGKNSPGLNPESSNEDEYSSYTTEILDVKHQRSEITPDNPFRGVDEAPRAGHGERGLQGRTVRSLEGWRQPILVRSSRQNGAPALPPWKRNLLPGRAFFLGYRIVQVLGGLGNSFSKATVFGHQHSCGTGLFRRLFRRNLPPSSG